jgi:hypothetical protein
MAEAADPDWVAEFVPRHSKEILILWKGDEVRGSFELFTTEEKNLWIDAIQWLNDHRLQSSTSQKSMGELSLPANAPNTSGPSSNQNIPT